MANLNAVRNQNQLALRHSNTKLNKKFIEPKKTKKLLIVKIKIMVNLN